MFRCFKQASETKDEIERKSLEYRQEGNVGDVGPVAPDGADAAAGNGVPGGNKTQKENPKTIKEKTTQQMAKSVPYLVLMCLRSCVFWFLNLIQNSRPF